MTKNKTISSVIYFIILSAIGFIMLYPLLWMISATFKTNAEISESTSLIIHSPFFEGYRGLFKKYGGCISIFKAMMNSFSFIIPKVILTVISCSVTAYGFSRFTFPMKKVFFALMLSSMFIPDTVMMIPQFIMYSKLGWVDSPLYTALVLPSAFASESYFVFMMIQFIKGIPDELDDAARIDGCSSSGIFFHIIIPLMKPAIVSAAVLQFIWSSNDFTGPLLYVSTPSKYPVSVFIKLASDSESGYLYSRVLALSLLAFIPSLTVFFFSQRSFTENITSGAVKG